MDLTNANQRKKIIALEQSILQFHIYDNAMQVFYVFSPSKKNHPPIYY